MYVDLVQEDTAVMDSIASLLEPVPSITVAAIRLLNATTILVIPIDWNHKKLWRDFVLLLKRYPVRTSHVSVDQVTSVAGSGHKVARLILVEVEALFRSIPALLIRADLVQLVPLLPTDSIALAHLAMLVTIAACYNLLRYFFKFLWCLERASKYSPFNG